MNEHEILEPDLEEVEPEAWPLDRVDENIEGYEGYDEEEAGIDVNSTDPLNN